MGMKAILAIEDEYDNGDDSVSIANDGDMVLDGEHYRRIQRQNGSAAKSSNTGNSHIGIRKYYLVEGKDE